MAVHLVAYDLKKIGQNYTDLTAALKALPNYHGQGSVWYVQYAGTEAALRNSLQAHLDDNDVLMVSEVSKTWAGVHMPEAGKWLNARGY